jgi:hypothetical protein
MFTLQQVGCDVGNFLSKGLIIATLTFSSIRMMLVVDELSRERCLYPMSYYENDEKRNF